MRNPLLRAPPVSAHNRSARLNLPNPAQDLILLVEEALEFLSGQGARPSGRRERIRNFPGSRDPSDLLRPSLSKRHLIRIRV